MLKDKQIKSIVLATQALINKNRTTGSDLFQLPLFGANAEIDAYYKLYDNFILPSNIQSTPGLNTTIQEQNIQNIQKLFNEMVVVDKNLRLAMSNYFHTFLKIAMAAGTVAVLAHFTPLVLTGFLYVGLCSKLAEIQTKAGIILGVLIALTTFPLVLTLMPAVALLSTALFAISCPIALALGLSDLVSERSNNILFKKTATEKLINRNQFFSTEITDAARLPLEATNDPLTDADDEITSSL